MAAGQVLVELLAIYLRLAANLGDRASLIAEVAKVCRKVCDFSWPELLNVHFELHRHAEVRLIASLFWALRS